ncbi:unnamed protein product [Ixodes pacificus]
MGVNRKRDFQAWKFRATDKFKGSREKGNRKASKKKSSSAAANPNLGRGGAATLSSPIARVSSAALTSSLVHRKRRCLKTERELQMSVQVLSARWKLSSVAQHARLAESANSPSRNRPLRERDWHLFWSCCNAAGEF